MKEVVQFRRVACVTKDFMPYKSRVMLWGSETREDETTW
jgi:hypothetical protein